VSAGLCFIAVALAAPPAPPGLQQGDQLTYVGTVTEDVHRPGREFRRGHELHLRVFVLERNTKWADVAVLTRLKRTSDAVSEVSGGLTAASGVKDTPPLIRLDFVRLYANGTAHLLEPLGPAPLRLDETTPTRALPLIPLDSFAASEFGVFPPQPPRDASEPWTVATGPERPVETWRMTGSKFFNAERCTCLAMMQESADWIRPTGGTAWQRAETVWVSTLDGTARRVHRFIRQRDGRAESPPAAWVEVKYELKEQAKLTGRTFERARRDIDVAYCAFADAAQPLAPRQFEKRILNLDAHLEESDTTGPYREALGAARRALEAARDGDAVKRQVGPAIPGGTTRTLWPEPGSTAPDIKTSNFRLAEQKGKLVLLAFLKPDGETTALSLAVADALTKRYGGRIVVVALVANGEVAAAARACNRLGLTVILHDGAAAAACYGVTTVPRFVLIDQAGKVRWTFTGIGAETGFLAREAADRLISPVSLGAPRRITASPEPIGVPIVPPP